jgi:hypothetical protein
MRQIRLCKKDAVTGEGAFKIQLNTDLAKKPRECLLEGNDRRRWRTGAIARGTSRRVANQSVHGLEMGQVAKRGCRLAAIRR